MSTFFRASAAALARGNWQRVITVAAGGVAYFTMWSHVDAVAAPDAYVVMASDLREMASDLREMASDLREMASSLNDFRAEFDSEKRDNASFRDEVRTSVPSVLRRHIPTRNSILETVDDADTFTFYEHDGRTFLMTCAHTCLDMSGGRELRVKRSLLEHFEVITVYLRKGALLEDHGAGAGDSCLLEIRPRPAFAGSGRIPQPLPLPLAPTRWEGARMVAGASQHGVCEGRVNHEPYREVPLMLGTAGPGNSGTVLYDAQHNMIGLLSGIDGEATAIPTTLKDVHQFGTELMRAQDRKRYAVVPGWDAATLGDATNLNTLDRGDSLDRPVYFPVTPSGVAILPTWIKLLPSLSELQYGGCSAAAASLSKPR